MKKNMKRSLAAALALAMMLTGLVGCSEKQNDASSSGVPASSQSASGSLSQQEKPSTGTKLTQENILNYPESAASDFESIWSKEGRMIVSCTSEDEVVVVPKKIDGDPVIGIASAGMALLPARAIVLPDTVQTIGDSAFNGCEELEYIHLGSGLKRIGDVAFNICPSLKQAIFPEGMEVIVQCPFIFCHELEKVVIPASVTTIPNGIFTPDDSPKAYIVTPEGSVADAVAAEFGIPVQRP